MARKICLRDLAGALPIIIQCRGRRTARQKKHANLKVSLLRSFVQRGIAVFSANVQRRAGIDQYPDFFQIASTRRNVERRRSKVADGAHVQTPQAYKLRQVRIVGKNVRKRTTHADKHILRDRMTAKRIPCEAS